MPDSPEIGRLRVPVVADLRPLRRAAHNELRRAAEEAGDDMGRVLGQGMGRRAARELAAALSQAEREFRRREREAQDALAARLIRPAEFRRLGEEAARDFNDALRRQMDQLNREGLLSPAVMVELERQMKTGGFAAGRGWLDALRRQFALREADLKEAQARGLLAPEEAAARAREIATEWNRTILDEIERRAEEGTLTDDLFLSLTSELRDAGMKGGREFGRGVSRTAQDELADLQRWLRGGFAVAVVGTFAMLASRIARFFGNLARQIREALEAGGAIRTERATFESVAAMRGLDPGLVVGELRQALRSTVPDVELMRRAVFALNAELPVTERQLGEIAALSRRLGLAAGIDAAEGFRRFVEGIAKGRAEQLQSLGIMTRQTDALREWERETGRSAASLDRQQRLLIHLNAVMEEARAKVGAMGAEADEAATPLQQLSTWWGNLRDSMVEAAATSPTVVGFLERMGEAAADSSERFRLLAAHFGAWVELSARHVGRGAGLAGRILGSAPFRFLGRTLLGGAGIHSLHAEWDALVREGLIRTETSVQRLLEMQVENLKQMVELQEQGVDAEDERITRLERQNELIRERIQALQATGEPTTPPPIGPTEQEIQAGERAFTALTQTIEEMRLAAELGQREYAKLAGEPKEAVQELLRLNREIAQVEEQIQQIRAAGLAVPEGAQAYLEHLRTLQAEAREAARGLIELYQRELPEVTVRLVNSMEQVTHRIPDVERLARAVAAAEQELTRARLAHDPARVARAERQLADARQALRDHVAQLVTELEASGIPARELNEHIERLVQLLEEAGIQVDELQRKSGDLAGLARDFESVARGVMSIADAMGVLDDRTRRVLQGAIELAAGVGQIAAGNVLTGGIQVAGGIAQLLSGVFGRSEAERRERLRQIDEMVRLRQALSELRTAVLRDVTAREREELVAGLENFAAQWEWLVRLPGVPTRDGRLSGTWRIRDMDPDVLEMVRNMERMLPGIQVISGDRFNWDAFWEGLDQLREMDIGLWGDTLLEKLDALDWLTRMLGDAAGDAATQLRRFLDVLRSAGAGNFADEFQRILDAQGAEAAKAWLDSLAEGMVTDAGALLSAGGIFFGLTAAQAQRILEQAGRYLTGPGGLVTETPETRLAVSITQAQASELLRIESTQLYHLAGIHSILASMASLPAPSYGIPEIGPPALPATGGGTTIDVGGITVEVLLGELRDRLTPDTARDIGGQIGAGISDALIERLRSAQRGAGATGSARVRVEVS